MSIYDVYPDCSKQADRMEYAIQRLLKNCLLKDLDGKEFPSMPIMSELIELRRAAKAYRRTKDDL